MGGVYQKLPQKRQKINAGGQSNGQGKKKNQLIGSESRGVVGGQKRGGKKQGVKFVKQRKGLVEGGEGPKAGSGPKTGRRVQAPHQQKGKEKIWLVC